MASGAVAKLRRVGVAIFDDAIELVFGRDSGGGFLKRALSGHVCGRRHGSQYDGEWRGECLGKEDEQRGRDDGTRTVEPWRGGIYPRKAESGIPRA